METNSTVCFTGQHPQSLPFDLNEDDECFVRLIALLRGSIRDLIENRGVTRFISGMTNGVDLYTAQIVLEEKKTHEGVTLTCTVPCEEQVRFWKPPQKALYKLILRQCDEILLLQNENDIDYADKRNRCIVDKSDIVLAVWDGGKGPTAGITRYAKERGKEIIIINPNEL